MFHLWADVVLSTFPMLHDWQTALEARGKVGERTRKLYLRAVLAFLVENPKPLEEMTEVDIAAGLRRITPKGGYRDQTLKALYSFYRWAEKEHGIADPTIEFGFKRKRSGPPDYLTHEDLERLFIGAESVDPRTRPTLELMYGTAARIHSITELRPGDVDMEHRIVRFVLGVKNDAAYSLPLGPRSYAASLRLIDLIGYAPRYGKRREGKLVGVGDQAVRDWMKKAAVAADLPMRTYPHLLRHSALTHLANDPEVSVATITAVANWQDPTPFKRYVAARSGEMKKALARL